MNDSSTRSPEKTDDNTEHTKGLQNISQDVALTPQPLAPGPFHHSVRETIFDEEAADRRSRSDSEAETVVQTGKEDTTPNPVRKAFKYENGDSFKDTEQVGVKKDSKERQYSESDAVEKTKAHPGSISSHLANNNSSNLSSARSSPVHRQQSPIGIRPKSRQSSPHNDSRTGLDAARSRKRKRETRHEGPGHSHKRSAGRAEIHLESRNQRESRESRKARKPAPLHVDQSRKESEEVYAESDDSGSAHANPYFRRLASGGHAASPVKVPHKKLRDKNGRTLLARACATDEADHVRARLQDRPEDLDIADNAGNTPLQIASLEGHAQIVEILLEAGCDIACKNIDLDTPLIDAVENGHLDVVRLLLNAGLDPRQSNAKGEEAIDLLDLSDDNGEEIKAALIEARDKDTRRRHSEEQHVPWSNRRDSVSVHSSRGSPPLHYPARSPSGNAVMPRRKTARSEITRNELLWIHPTAENLRERAAVNDVESVTRILEMRHDVDVSEAVLLAARAGHEQLLNLLLAIGQTEPDPDPLPSSSYTEGRNTPMLAAIGRGKVEIVRLLLSKPGFDPTRRLYRDLAYHELAKDRKGDSWEEEYRILKEAYDNYVPQVSQNGLIDRSESQDQEAKRLKQNNLSSSSHDSPRRKSLNPGPKDARSSKSRSLISRNATIERNDDSNRRHHKSGKQRHDPISSSRESSVAVSDPETGAALEDPKKKRSSSDTGSVIHLRQSAKPRRKLITGREYNSGKGNKRRDTASSSSDQGNIAVKSENSLSLVNAKEQTSVETPSNHTEIRKKRPRKSVSPVNDDHNRPSRAIESHEKIKRRRLLRDTSAISQNGNSPQPGSAAVANMVPSPHSSGPPPGAAPVAFMGNPNTSPLTSPSKVSISEVNTTPAATTIDKSIQDLIHSQEPRNLIQTEETTTHLPHLNRRDSPNSQTHPDHTIAGEIPDQQQQGREIKDKLEKDKAAEAERQSRIAHEMEEAVIAQQRLEEQRKVEEAKNIARLEREAEEARLEKRRRDDEMQKEQAEQKRAEQERAEQERAEQERAEQERAEQERAEQERAEQERVEQERLRMEEQERRRSELEEHERLMRLRKQQEEERKKQEAFPNALKNLIEMKPEQARTSKEVKHWLPMYTITGKELDPLCSDEGRDEKWIINLQAAPILGTADLDLPQYTTWTKHPATGGHRYSVWRVLRVKLAHLERPSYVTVSVREAREQDMETETKYYALERIFWIKLSDFMEITPRFPHLNGVSLHTAPMLLRPDPNSPNGSRSNGFPHPPLHNSRSSAANSGLTNGWH